MKLDSITAQMLLMKCTGDEIWPVEICRSAGIPEAWISELADCFESGFDSDRNTIYKNENPVNQFHGVLDLHLAYKLAEFLGIDWRAATNTALGRRAEVRALQEALEEM